MVTIISNDPNKLQDNWPKQITCRSCGAVLKYGKKDVRYGYIWVHNQPNDKMEFYIDCPASGCEAKTAIPEKDLPLYLKERLIRECHVKRE